MATILAHIRVKPGCEAEFETIAASLYRQSHANDPGLRRYEYWRGQQPRTYYALLAFDDYRAFMVHQTSAHHEAAVPALGGTIEALELEWVGPVKGASPLPPTQPQALEPGASEIARAYDERMRIMLPDWWILPR